MFQHVIVRRPCPSVCEGITSAPELGKPDYQKALCQHDAYIEALKRCGVDVTVLDAMDEFPDSCFVEDTAVLTPLIWWKPSKGFTRRTALSTLPRLARWRAGM